MDEEEFGADNLHQIHYDAILQASGLSKFDFQKEHKIIIISYN